MLLTFTEASTGDSIAINPTCVQAVFIAPQGDFKGSTVLSIGGQPICVKEEYTEVVGQINGALK